MEPKAGQERARFPSCQNKLTVKPLRRFTKLTLTPVLSTALVRDTRCLYRAAHQRQLLHRLGKACLACIQFITALRPPWKLRRLTAAQVPRSLLLSADKFASILSRAPVTADHPAASGSTTRSPTPISVCGQTKPSHTFFLEGFARSLETTPTRPPNWALANVQTAVARLRRPP